MCGSVQRQTIVSWHAAGEDQETNCTRGKKIAVVVGTTFTVAAFAFAFWGYTDVGLAAQSQDTALLQTGLLVLVGAAAASIVSTIAWTCLCMARGEEEITPQAGQIV